MTETLDYSRPYVRMALGACEWYLQAGEVRNEQGRILTEADFGAPGMATWGMVQREINNLPDATRQAVGFP